MMGCERCDGGWKPVTESYVVRLAPMPAPLDLALAAEPGMADAYDALVLEVEARRASLRQSVYPCKDCNSSAFYRWAGRHFEVNHDRTGCAECREYDAQRRHRSRSSSSPRQRDLLRDGPAPTGPPAPLEPLDRKDLF